jgi:glutathione S-transferase
MRFELYFAPGACSFVPHTLLEASGEAFEPKLLKLHKGEQKSPEFLALNPNGQVPLLVDGGTPIAQIVGICLHLEACFPGKNWLPTSGVARAQALSWLLWMNNVAHPTFTHVFMPAKFTPDEAAQASVKAHNLALFGEVLAKLDAEIAKRGTPFWLGDSFSPLDAYSLTLARWGSMVGHDPSKFPALWALVGRTAALPAVARVIERERLTLNLFAPAAPAQAA